MKNRKPKRTHQKPRAGYRLIFRRYRTDKSGKRLDAHAYGKKAWPMWVRK